MSLCVGLTDAYNIGIVVSWYGLIYMSYILFHIRLEDGLYISVLRDRQLVTKVGTAIEKFLKKSSNFKRRIWQHPAGQSPSIHKIRAKPGSTMHEME
jgi:hypothetical protein